MLLHEDYQLYVLPRIQESKRMAKAGRTKQKEADLEYSVAKQVEKMIGYDRIFYFEVSQWNHFSLLLKFITNFVMEILWTFQVTGVV